LKDDAKSPWGSDNKYLFSLYQGEHLHLGEEQSVIGEIDEDKIPVTGNSRFGCWICTMVKEDKSLKAFIDGGETWLVPLRDYRDWMLEMRSTPSARETKRRNGAMYRKADGSLEAGRYTYNGTDWNVIKESKQKISSFTNVASNWEVAPAVYLLESFANSSQGDFTLQNVLLTGGLSYVWIPTASYGMKASAFVNQNNPSEAWLISPIVDLTEAEKPVLSFDQASKFGDLLNECFVMVSVDYEDDVTNCDWVHIPYNQDEDGKYIIPDGSNWTFMATGDLDLSAFAGQRVTIGFKYTSTATSATTWEVKNLVVKENK
jgi:hypothetical protein